MEEKRSFFGRLKDGLAKTRNNIISGMDAVFNGFSQIDEDFYEELLEILIIGDIGIHAAEEIIGKLKKQVRERHIKEPTDCKQLLIESIKELMSGEEIAYEFENKQAVILVIGVNGVGKTTTIGKIAMRLNEQGKKVILAAADTFRAAAGEQLEAWAERSGAVLISGSEGADPASVIYDAVCAAKARKADVLICDTAGRLHNKKNLMEELKKINRIIEREFPEAHRENLLVLDGTTGQNALNQAREFGEAAELSGLVLTKLDGTAKGGIAIAIQAEMNVPVKYIGVGEKITDLEKFKPDEFVAALFESGY
ncbi:MAG: signal recognition particle-docking protein FtsY [Lachnospiraceae bacterium]|nr:signal recognition particle-docking protein FtsY [Lachnospiraceae bacterium]